MNFKYPSTDQSRTLESSYWLYLWSIKPLVWSKVFPSMQGMGWTNFKFALTIGSKCFAINHLQQRNYCINACKIMIKLAHHTSTMAIYWHFKILVSKVHPNFLPLEGIASRLFPPIPAGIVGDEKHTFCERTLVLPYIFCKQPQHKSDSTGMEGF